jgi:hypothetical protein
MAQTTNHLRDLLEKIKADARQALALLPSEAESRSLGWKCAACGQVKHFTRPVPSEVASPCRSAKAMHSKNAETLGVRPFLLTAFARGFEVRSSFLPRKLHTGVIQNPTRKLPLHFLSFIGCYDRGTKRVAVAVITGAGK